MEALLLGIVIVAMLVGWVWILRLALREAASEERLA